MTDRELMQMALDALEAHADIGIKATKQIETLRARLAQPEPEPVTMVISKTGDSSVTMSWWHEPALPVGTSLYTAPLQRSWQGLTDEEIEKFYLGSFDEGQFARAIEAKLKEKNT